MGVCGDSVPRYNDETASPLFKLTGSALGNIRICLYPSRVKPHSHQAVLPGAHAGESAKLGLGDYLVDKVVLCPK